MTATPSDKRPISPIEELVLEKPAQLMAQLRSVWPEVERAAKIGHTLRVIHERLNQMGLPITYQRLTVYCNPASAGRRMRTVEAYPATRTTVAPTAAGKEPSTTFDPLANLRAQEKKRVEWRYPSGPPDESKLF